MRRLFFACLPGALLVGCQIEDTTAGDETAALAADTDADADPDCRIEVEPALGAMTPSFEPDTACSCSASNTDCHTLYQGAAESLDVNSAALTFQKVSGEPASTDVSYWVAVGADTNPGCQDLDAFVTRVSGTWSGGETALTVGGIDVWPSEADFDAAPAGETKKLFLITGGGGGYETDRVWFQQQALVFTKVCD